MDRKFRAFLGLYALMSVRRLVALGGVSTSLVGGLLGLSYRGYVKGCGTRIADCDQVFNGSYVFIIRADGFRGVRGISRYSVYFFSSEMVVYGDQVGLAWMSGCLALMSRIDLSSQVGR